MQQELMITGAMPGGMRSVPSGLVAKCKTLQDAMKLCINHADRYWTNEELAEALSVPDGRAGFSKIINADKAKKGRSLDYQKTRKLQQLCRNTAIEQWCDLHDKGMLDFQRSSQARIDELQRQIEEEHRRAGLL